MKKAEMLEHWKRIPRNLLVTPSPVPYKHEGSTYDQDGIRITGSRDFIDSVLSRLKDLLENENDETRLQVSYTETKDRETGEPTGTYNCYIQVHMRGRQARLVNAMVRSMAS